MKRLTSIFVAFCLVSGILSTVSLASIPSCTYDENCTHTAAVGEIHYDTLSEAVPTYVPWMVNYEIVVLRTPAEDDVAIINEPVSFTVSYNRENVDFSQDMLIPGDGLKRKVRGMSYETDNVEAYTFYDCDITYDPNGGTFITETYLSDGAISTGSYNLPGAFRFTAPEGKHFSAWEINGVLYLPNEWVNIREDTVIKAIWSDNGTFSVMFDTNSENAIQTQTVKEGALAVRPANPTKEGYIFDGWYTDEYFYFTERFNFGTTKINADTKLYASWLNADEVAERITLTIDKTEAVVFGDAVTNDVAPIIRNGRTMLPARFIAENLGAKVGWDNDERKVTITKGDTEILIYIDSDTAKVNGEDVKLDSPAFIENSRTYTPVRFIVENLGANIEWKEDEREVVIIKE